MIVSTVPVVSSVGKTVVAVTDSVIRAFSSPPVLIALSALGGIIVVLVVFAVLTRIFSASNDRRIGAQSVMDWLLVLARGYRNDPPPGSDGAPPASLPDPAPPSDPAPQQPDAA